MKTSIRQICLTGVLLAAVLILSSAANAQKGITKKVRFACGASSVVLTGAIARGTENRYIVTAKEGQTMTVRITSPERNANFIIFYAGEQESLEGADGVTDWNGQLVADNNYVVVVGATRGGGAAYTLKIAVR